MWRLLRGKRRIDTNRSARHLRRIVFVRAMQGRGRGGMSIQQRYTRGITYMADEIERLERERDEWRVKYYTLRNGIQEKLREMEAAK